MLRESSLLVAIIVLAGCLGGGAPQAGNNTTAPAAQPPAGNVSDLEVTRYVQNVTVMLILRYDGKEFSTSLMAPAGTTLLAMIERGVPIEYVGAMPDPEIASVMGVERGEGQSWNLYIEGKPVRPSAVITSDRTVELRLEPVA